MYMQSNLARSFGHISVAQEIECSTLNLVGGVATTIRVWGSNPEAPKRKNSSGQGGGELDPI